MRRCSAQSDDDHGRFSSFTVLCGQSTLTSAAGQRSPKLPLDWHRSEVLSIMAPLRDGAEVYCSHHHLCTYSLWNPMRT